MKRTSIYSDIETQYVFVLTHHNNGTSSIGRSQTDFLMFLFNTFIYEQKINLVTLEDDGKPCDEDWEDKQDGCSGTMHLEDTIYGDTVGQVWMCHKCRRNAEYDRGDMEY